MAPTAADRKNAERERGARFVRASEPVAATPASSVADATGRFEYAVDRVQHRPVRHGRFERDLTAALDARASDGWRAVTILPQDGGDAIIVFERPADPSAPAVKGPQDARSDPPSKRPATPWPPPDLLREAPAPSPLGSVSSHAAVATPAETDLDDDRRSTVVRRWSRHMPLIAVVTASGLAAASALAFIAFDADDPAPTGATAPEPSASPAIPPCATVARAALAGGPVTCATPSGVLKIVSGTRPLLLDGVELRALKATRTPTTATIRARVRNTGSRPLRVSRDSGTLYLRLGGRRIAPSVERGPVVIPGGEARTLRLTFPLDTRARRTLARTESRVDLGVREPGAAGEAARRGAVRLRLGR